MRFDDVAAYISYMITHMISKCARITCHMSNVRIPVSPPPPFCLHTRPHHMSSPLHHMWCPHHITHICHIDTRMSHHMACCGPTRTRVWMGAGSMAGDHDGRVSHTCTCNHGCLICMYVCMYVCMYGCMHVCMFGCMHVCMYVCMYVCVNV